MLDPKLLESVISEVRSLFHRLRATAGELHGLGQSSAGLRGVLESLAEHGPQTVPQLARARPVSRQHIQTLVNELVEQGLVRLVDNPAHKRSKLVELTSAGRVAQGRMRQLEERLLAQLPIQASAKQLETTVSVLRQVRDAIENPAWRGTVRKAARVHGKGDRQS
jgi:DNA-binding MarR family transcriptional regulator